MKEIINIHVGQAGNQIGFAIWELFCAEHFITKEGICYDSKSGDTSFNTFFMESHNKHYVPRALFIDLEPTVVHQLRSGAYRNLFNPTQVICGYDDSSANFSRAFNTLGRVLYQPIYNQIRRQIECCDRMQTTIFYRSLGGGAGSGLTSMIIEMFEDFSKSIRIEFPVHPSPHIDTNIVSPYNSILGEHFCLDEFDVGLVMDNESLYDLCSNTVDIAAPTMSSINRILAQVGSNLTAASRFHNDLYNDISVVLTNIVPYPRIHFPLVSMAPVMTSRRIERDINDITAITRAVFEPANQLVKCDPSLGKYMSCSLVYRGMINPIVIYKTLAEIKLNRKIRFVDWCPTGFKVGIVDQPPLILESSNMGQTQKNVVMMTNNSAISSIWQRLSHKFHRLYTKRSFVHWFVSEGLEESEFCEALYNIATLAKDYEEVSIDSNLLENDLRAFQGGEGEDECNTQVATEGLTSTVVSTNDEDDEENEQYNTSNLNILNSAENSVISDNNNNFNYKTKSRSDSNINSKLTAQFSNPIIQPKATFQQLHIKVTPESLPEITLKLRKQRSRKPLRHPSVRHKFMSEHSYSSDEEASILTNLVNLTSSF